jgi:hypothetical protein
MAPDPSLVSRFALVRPYVTAALGRVFNALSDAAASLAGIERTTTTNFGNVPYWQRLGPDPNDPSRLSLEALRNLSRNPDEILRIAREVHDSLRPGAASTTVRDISLVRKDGWHNYTFSAQEPVDPTEAARIAATSDAGETLLGALTLFRGSGFLSSGAAASSSASGVPWRQYQTPEQTATITADALRRSSFEDQCIGLGRNMVRASDLKVQRADGLRIASVRMSAQRAHLFPGDALWIDVVDSKGKITCIRIGAGGAEPLISKLNDEAQAMTWRQQTWKKAEFINRPDLRTSAQSALDLNSTYKTMVERMPFQRRVGVRFMDALDALATNTLLSVLRQTCDSRSIEMFRWSSGDVDITYRTIAEQNVREIADDAETRARLTDDADANAVSDDLVAEVNALPPRPQVGPSQDGTPAPRGEPVPPQPPNPDDWTGGSSTDRGRRDPESRDGRSDGKDDRDPAGRDDGRPEAT